MKLTKERKVYAAVLGLGLSALAADRLFSGGATLAPGSAAAAGPDVIAAAPAAQEVAGERSATDAPPCALAARLEGIRPQVVRSKMPASIFAVGSPLHPDPRSLLNDPAETVGLFSTKAAWLMPAAKAAANAAPEKPKETLKDVLGRHKINTVVIKGSNGKESFILVDDKLDQELNVGASFDGIRILAITKGTKATAKAEWKPSSVTLGFGEERLEIDFENIGSDR